jgi:hypothetical protein
MRGYEHVISQAAGHRSLGPGQATLVSEKPLVQLKSIAEVAEGLGLNHGVRYYFIGRHTESRSMERLVDGSGLSWLDHPCVRGAAATDNVYKCFSSRDTPTDA